MTFSKPFLLMTSLFIIAIYALSWTLYNSFSPNWDIVWLMEAAKRMLHGGSYTTDFFETNPPLILYLYLPPLFISKFLAIDLILTFRVYIFLLSALSLLLCYHFAKRIFVQQHPFVLFSIFITLALCYLILPLYELGQRDHLLVILAMPYLFAITYRLQNGTMTYLTACSIGLLAGLGFAIKPHFLITAILIECYCLYKKNIFYWQRPEVFILWGFVGIYIASIIIFFPDYFSFIVPFSLNHYYAAISAPWTSMLVSPLSLFCWLPFLLLVVIKPQHQPYQSLSAIFSLALTGYLFAYLSQRNTFYYHFIPPLSLAILLLMILFISFLTDFYKHKSAYFFTILLIILFSIFPMRQWYDIYQNWAGHKQKINKLTFFMQTYAQHQPVYFLTTTMVYSFPSIYYAKARFSSRFPFLWMLAGLVNQTNNHSTAFLADKNLLIRMISEDLNKNKPLFVFVDESEKKPYLVNTSFNYLHYLSQDLTFKNEWKSYQYLTTIEQHGLYKLSVYQRQ